MPPAHAVSWDRGRPDRSCRGRREIAAVWRIKSAPVDLYYNVQLKGNIVMRALSRIATCSGPALLLALGLAGLAPSPARAEQLCYPRCDYTHYYGPFDFTYIQPGLFAWPRCGPQGDCAPHLAYTTGIVRRTGRITVRFPRVTPP
jgi:hypothetical protein